MKKNYVTPTMKSIKVRIENNLLDASPTGELTVTNEENNGGYDAKDELYFGW